MKQQCSWQIEMQRSMVSNPSQTSVTSEVVLEELWRNARLSIKADYDVQPEVLKVGDAVIGTLGNFSAAIGKAKSKKTFNCSAVVAAAINNDCVLNYIADFPEGKRKILYIDTEQGASHCLTVLQRIHKLAELPTDKDCENLEFLALRKYSPEDRTAIIEYAITHTEGLGLVVVDGIRDLVYDINNPTEATNIISKLMQWTDEYQIHIHVILHQNKGDENARGHLGTELINKAETIIQIEKDKNDHSISKVEAVHIRTVEFEPFAFRINDDGLPVLAPDYVFEESSPGRPKQPPFDPKSIDMEKTKAAMMSMFSGNQRYGYKELEDAIINAYAKVNIKLNHNKTVALIAWLRKNQVIIKMATEAGKKNVLNPEYNF